MGGHGFSPWFCPEAPVIERVLLSPRDLGGGRHLIPQTDNER